MKARQSLFRYLRRAKISATALIVTVWLSIRLDLGLRLDAPLLIISTADEIMPEDLFRGILGRRAEPGVLVPGTPGAADEIPAWASIANVVMLLGESSLVYHFCFRAGVVWPEEPADESYDCSLSVRGSGVRDPDGVPASSV